MKIHFCEDEEEGLGRLDDQVPSLTFSNFTQETCEGHAIRKNMVY
jgi:hypothetical protein